MKVYLVSENPHKLREIEPLSGGKFELELISSLVPPRPVVEDAKTFRGNSLKKIEAYIDLKVPLIADDSGLEIDALWGFPGVRSARFMEWAPYRERMDALLARVEGQKRSARFVCAAFYYDPLEDVLLGTQGVIEGEIAHRRAGEEGFGYDPIFVPQGRERTFAELGERVKLELSHRARAFRKLFSLALLCSGRK